MATVTTTNKNPGRYLIPGDIIIDSRAAGHQVFMVLHTGYGYAGVVLTHQNGKRFALWVADAFGNVRATMTTTDRLAAVSAFETRTARAIHDSTTDGN